MPVLTAAHGEDAGLEAEELAEERLRAIALKESAAGERLAQTLESHTIPIRRLADYELIGLDAQSGIRRQLERLCDSHGKRLRFRLVAGGWAAAKECARRGLGVAVVPLSVLVREDRKALTIRCLAGDVSLRYLLIWRRKAANPVQEVLQQALRQAVEAQQAELRDRWHGIFFL